MHIYIYICSLDLNNIQMVSKIDRQKMILKIIESKAVHNQDELQQYLQERGLAVTQATLSRDINALNLSKYRGEDGNLYYARGKVFSELAAPQSHDASGIISVELCGNMGVIRTHPGFANVVAFSIDRSQPEVVAGTIAGDDTVFLVLRGGGILPRLKAQLGGIFPGVEEKFI